jgi:hypothetical protein
MDIIINSKQFTDKEIKRLNYCRLHLQAVTLSDLTKANGTHLDPAMLQGQPDRASSVSRWHYVNQDKPEPEAQWQLWRKANKLWSDDNGALLQPLTRWIAPIRDQRRQWHVYGDMKGRIYVRQHQDITRQASSGVPSLYLRYQVAPKRDSQHIIFSYAIPTIVPGNHTPQQHIAVPLPQNVTPVDIQHQEAVTLVHYDGGKIRRHKPRRIPRNMPQNEDFYSYLANKLDPWEAELLKYVNMKHDAFSTYRRMQESFHAAGDGSVRYEYHGSFGWTISSTKGERLVEAYGPVRGFKPTSYRAEGYGMLSILRFVKQLQTYCQVNPSWSWTLTSDNISLVNQVNGVEDEDNNDAAKKTTSPHDWSTWKNSVDNDLEDSTANWAVGNSQSTTNITLEADWDVLNEIRWTLANDGVGGVKISHIPSHQDKKQPYEELSLQAQLNVDADRLASKFQDIHGAPIPEVLLFPHSAAQVNLRNHGTITYRLPQMLRRAETELPLAKYIGERNGWSAAVMDTIDWQSHERAIKKNNKRRIHLTKLIHDILPTNHQVHRQDPRRQQCPLCRNGSVIEDRDHVIRCPGEQRAIWRAQTITSMENRCVTLNTDPMLATIMIDGLHMWMNTPETLMPEKYPRKYDTLIRQQNRIGWRQLFSGRLCREWARLQNDYLYIRHQRFLDTRRQTQANRYSGCQTEGMVLRGLPRLFKRSGTDGLKYGHFATLMYMGRTKPARQEQRDLHDRMRLQTIYEQSDRIEPRVRDELLYENIEDHLQNSRHTLNNWLAVHEATISQSIKVATKRAIQGIQPLNQIILRNWASAG